MRETELPDEIVEKARRVRLLLMDCDGVLTDGRLFFSENGEIMKVFHVRDGQGLAEWHAAGYESGIITGRGARPILEARTAELGILHLYTSSRDKLKDLERIMEVSGIRLEEIAYIGDDIGDICLLERVGLSVVVADAAESAVPFADFKTKRGGGQGAVRELTDLLLFAKAEGFSPN